MHMDHQSVYSACISILLVRGLILKYIHIHRDMHMHGLNPGRSKTHLYVPRVKRTLPMQSFLPHRKSGNIVRNNSLLQETISCSTRLQTVFHLKKIVDGWWSSADQGLKRTGKKKGGNWVWYRLTIWHSLCFIILVAIIMERREYICDCHAFWCTPVNMLYSVQDGVFCTSFATIYMHVL